MKRIALILSLFIGFGLSAYADDESKESGREAKPERESASREVRRDGDRGKAESRRETPRTEEGRDAERHRFQPERGRPEAEERLKKIQHIHEAAENLELAGMHREAGDLREHAENLERAWHESHRPHRPHGPGDERIVHLEHQVHEMREVIGRLQRELEAIRREVKSGKGD